MNNRAKKNASRGLAFSIRILASIISLLLAVSAQASFHSSSVINTISANHEVKDHEAAKLYDGTTSYYYSGATNDWKEAAYLEVDLKDGMLKEDDEDNCLVVMVIRHEKGLDDAHPTSFKVEGQFGESNEWVQLFYTYFLYRGGLTTEYSERIPVANLWKNVSVNVSKGTMSAETDGNRTGKEIKKLRFTVLSNNNNRKHETTGGNDFHDMALNAFDVVKLPKAAEMPGGFSNRFHLTSDYLRDIRDFKFVNTSGILDPRNATKDWNYDYSDTLQLESKGISIKMPDYHLINSNNSKYPLDSDQKRQPAHTVEHIMYAIPGDIVTLYPYYELYKTPKFQINYSHWYDYKTGGRLQYDTEWSSGAYDLLDFLSDPSKIQVTDKHGFFGGQHLNITKYIVNSPEDWKVVEDSVKSRTASEKAKDYPACFYIELGQDIDFKGKEMQGLTNDPSHPCSFYINGNGYRISNLNINQPKDGSVGLIRYSGEGTIIENLYIDNTCKIVGKYNVGIIGEHRGGKLTFRNVHTEATVYGTQTANNEQTAAGLLGFCNNTADNPLLIENCYVGGKIGDPENRHAYSRNAALIAWWTVENNNAPAVLKNVIVDCDLVGYEVKGEVSGHGDYKRYIRQKHNDKPITIDDDGTIHKGIFSFYKCYGNIDLDDECWIPTNREIQVPNEKISNLIEAGWADAETPPMKANYEVDLSEYPYTRHYSAGNAKQYIEAVNAINSRTDRSVKVYFYLTQDIDFTGYAENEVPMLGDAEDTAFNGFLNGQGHTIKNLKMKRTGNYNYVGIVRYAGDGVRIENLILDESCYFEGPQYVSLVGTHLGGLMKVSNYKTEATFIGTHTTAEQCAAGVLGINKNQETDNVINLSDIYIGGNIGNQEIHHTLSRNAALIGRFENRNYPSAPSSESTLKNVVVRCDLYFPDNSEAYLKYIRHKKNKETISEDKENHIVTKANFKFDACYGEIDEADICWRKNEKETVLQREGWADNANPPVESVTEDSSIESGYTIIKEVYSESDYIKAVNETNLAASSSNICISIRADLNFENIDTVPMIGSQSKPFVGCVNGNGHKITELIIKKSDPDVGLISWADDGVCVKNLLIDSSCIFEGSSHVGLVGQLKGGSITVRNVKTEATVRGNATSGEHCAAGILGYCQAKDKNNVLDIENVYIGGVVGNEAIGSNNGAISGWFDNRNYPNYPSSNSTIKNVVVECKLHRPDNGTCMKYIRHKLGDRVPVLDYEGYLVKGNFRFKNCYGSLDKDNDMCWSDEEPESVISWANVDNPVPPTNPIEVDLEEYPYTRHYSACDAAQYIEMVMTINSLSDRNVYFELTDDIDFSGYPSLPMLGEKPNMAFSGFLNGNGHKIKNMTITRTDKNVGIIGNADDGVKVENLFVDSSCEFVGTQNIGIIGYLTGGTMSVANINTFATVRGTASGEQAAGGILGKVDKNSASVNNVMNLKNVHVGGVIGNKDDAASHNNGAVVGWFENDQFKNFPDSKSILENIVVDCKLYNPDSENARKKFIRHRKYSLNEFPVDEINDYTRQKANLYFINCFGSVEIDDKDACWLPLNVKAQLREFPTLEGWINNTTPEVYEGDSDNVEKLQNNIGDRTPGTSATFLFPWCPYLEKTEQTKLAFPEGEDEYVIAADFSQRFDIDRNMDKGEKTLYEPVIAVRHIFRIRDGRQFADSLSGSIKNNKEHLRKNMKIVSARAGVPFQIRLTTPIPADKNGRSNYYYKLDEDMYAHICGMGIRVLNGETRAPYDTNMGFKFTEAFEGLGTRTINGVAYATGDGNKKFYRMLALDSPEPNAHYIVQLIAKDDAGNDINIYDTNEKLVVMEYDITFLPARGASLLTEEKLYSDDNYKHARIEYLNENYGIGPNKEPSTVIDFDEYIKINQLADETLKNKFVKTTSSTTTGIQKSYFKWPLEWSLSDYSFGYDNRQDYNMYMLATHSDVVPYKDAAKTWKNNAVEDGEGLYDRLYYKTKRMIKNGTLGSEAKMQQGYFYYVNAATDPGVTARLKINDLCPGSTIHVSAWMAEFSNTTETANLSFNFVAVLRDSIEQKYPSLGLGNGERIVLHQFITGYVPSDKNNGAVTGSIKNDDKRGQWLNIYYSFVPRLSDFASETLTSSMVDHYEIELDNNAKNSAGADYAIDDIRAYVVPPTIEAKQLSPLCGDDDLRIRVASPFDTLLELAGRSETTSKESSSIVSLYYTFVDKQAFDTKMAQSSDIKEDYKSIFEETSVKIPNGYSRLEFLSTYSENKDYYQKTEFTDSVYRLRDKDTGERFIVFENLINESIKRNPNKEYYLVLNTAEGNITPETEGVAEFFRLYDDCAPKCVMKITPSNIVKVNGAIQTEKGKLLICENTSPVIQANVTRLTKSGEQVDVNKHDWFDWFLGPIDEFNKYSEDNNSSHLLSDAIYTVRAHYPEADNVDDIKPTEGGGDKEIKPWMIDLIKEASTKIDATRGCPLLTLRQRSYVIPPVTIPEDMDSVEVKVTAIPIINYIQENDTILVCKEASELTLVINHKAPLLRHGFSGIEYPDALTDVPLRIGLDQIREISSGEMKTIEIPVREASSPDNSVTALGRVKENKASGETATEVQGCIVLVETNDPVYKNILEAENDKEAEDIEFPWVGEIVSLTADIKGDNDNDIVASDNHFLIQLHEDFDVKEGYYYKLRFDYEELVENEKSVDAICNGQDLLTLKIVPKFQVWNGSENLNWNNDDNWSRLDAAEIFSDKKAEEHKHFVTDGENAGVKVNDRVKSYAPLDFTYVVIKTDENKSLEAPYLYATSSDSLISITDRHGETFAWPKNTEPKVSASDDYSDYPELLGEATQWIEYDMAAKTLDEPMEEVDIRCRPWYMNSCKEIHFKPGGTIMNQQELHYEKAWVDVELDHSRWQTLSTPLKEVYAGDFYLPSDNARQKTELFQPIEFDNTRTINDRFKPAVYQRGWDKATANVYELENQSFDSPRNVAVKTFWSHVYNDVTVEYGKGNGFSIKTDVSAMDTVPEEDQTVLFRLPKADNEYLYYTQDGSQKGHNTKMDRTHSYRLNDTEGTITAVSADVCSYFLVGNPFMTHMDIQKFISANSGKIEQKYWVITKNGQIAGEFVDSGQFIAANPIDEDWADDPTVIAPMQGFFVKAVEATDTLKLKYDEPMMRRYDSRDRSLLTSTTRAEESKKVLKIVAECEGFPATAALLSTDTVGHSWIDVEAIDNRGLDVPATVYTTKNGKALSINCCSDAEGTEIGVIADDDTETLLRFSGVDALEGLSLLDKADHSLTPLEEGMEIVVNGAAAGRYFLTYGISGDGVMSGIEWSVNGGVLTAVDNAASGYLEVNVYDTLGRLLKHASTGDSEISVPIERGIYVVDIKSAKDRISIKVRI